jgi:Ca2+-binding RTX toxin-like protein
MRSVLAAVAACLVLPGTALAATVRIDGDTLVYKSAPGEADRISADDFETNRWSFEGSFVQAGPGCEQTPLAAEVTCPLTAKAVIDLGDEDDRAGVFVHNLTVAITGGDGNDQMNDRDFHGMINGGAGRDRLRGVGPGKLIGGSGDDTIRPSNHATVDAGPGTTA